MSYIVLISCVSKKLTFKSKASDLYISPLFRKNLKYAESLKPDYIFILSAKYGIVELDSEIQPYDKTLNKMNVSEKKEWAKLVLSQLSNYVDLSRDEFTILAGNNYRKYLTPQIKKYNVPMEGLAIGKQLQWLSQRV
jgi:hypothetical protein